MPVSALSNQTEAGQLALEVGDCQGGTAAAVVPEGGGSSGGSRSRLQFDFFSALARISLGAVEGGRGDPVFLVPLGKV